MNHKIKEIENWVEQHDQTRLYQFEEPVRSVEEAMRVSGREREDFIKTIVVKNKTEDYFVAAVIRAVSRVDFTKLSEKSEKNEWRMANKHEIFSNTGYPVGGVPPVCLEPNVEIIIDPLVLKRSVVIGGGGTSKSLLELPSKLLKSSNVKIKNISND